ncbi:hypothetical protein HYDPIDRAFT_113303 [Hydnomerulius pinastri MD-312]|uniref:Uncharacterized protein n=1 Tax=Hydnomerulius pinastri MD-312 TaxID=994086 RepID=A0A0C9W7R7_9AGAM|nr:hypothetical protein HYDPIDRAFT_113303 [Hydnomerulius pinastri MD-312]
MKTIRTPVLRPLLGDGEHDSVLITRRGRNGKKLAHPYELFTREGFEDDGSPQNMIPYKLTNGKAPCDWAGNLLALKQKHAYSSEWLDCSLEEDLPKLVKFFEWYTTDVDDEMHGLFGDPEVIADLEQTLGADCLNVLVNQYGARNYYG